MSYVIFDRLNTSLCLDDFHRRVFVWQRAGVSQQCTVQYAETSVKAILSKITISIKFTIDTQFSSELFPLIKQTMKLIESHTGTLVWFSSITEENGFSKNAKKKV